MKQTKLYRAGTVALLGLMLLGLVGCWQWSTEERAIASPNPVRTQVAQGSTPLSSTRPDVNPKLVSANTRFGFKLFSEILKTDRNQNVFVSPSSIALALAMTYNGASGDTQTAMAKALELQGMSLAEFNQANANLKALLDHPDDQVQLAIANSIWTRAGIPFKSDFMQRNQQFYRAQVTDLDFASPQAPATINSWVKENTRDKIQQVVDQLNPEDVMLLVNAIYFKGAWTDKFDRTQTSDRPFTLANGQQKSLPMMSQQGEYKYYETAQFQAVSLPYGQGRVSMYVFLPKQTSGLSSFQKTLTADNWQQWMTQFRKRPGAVQIPRFKLEYDVGLKDALSALGMGIAFDDRANFSNLSSRSTQIDQVLHKTFVEVNEAGTEAAATTSVRIGITSAQPAPIEPFRLVVDRPFFCAIRDNRTGTILFMGSIVEPK